MKYTRVKYEGPNSYQSKDMANVKVFAGKQTDKWTGQKLYAPDLSMQGHKNQITCILRYQTFMQLTSALLNQAFVQHLHQDKIPATAHPDHQYGHLKCFIEIINPWLFIVR